MLSPHSKIQRRLSVVVLLVVLALLAVPIPRSTLDVGAEEPDAALSEPAGQVAPIGTLEVPPPQSKQSGIGVITGWVCDAERVTLRVDGHEIEAAYGTGRNDTQGICGDTNNGFGYLINWNALSDGPDRIEALADGVLIGASDVAVTTLGEPFRRGLAGTYDLIDFPSPGRSTTVQWVESTQGLRIVAPRQIGAASNQPNSPGSGARCP